MTKMKLYLLIVSVTILFSCAAKPSEEEIKAKLLSEYGCADQAEVSEMKILSTEETKGTDIKHVYRYTVAGEIKWPGGCNEPGKQTAAGSQESFEKLVVLTKTDEGWK